MAIYYLKTRLRKLIKYLGGLIKAVRITSNNFYNKSFNRVVKNQLKDLKSIPILVVNFNQLFYLEKLIQFLLERDFKNIVILDNKSDYEPLLNYYESIKDQVSIEYLQENAGHRVFWKSKELKNKYGSGYYVITDADIVPSKECPEDFLEKMMQALNNDRSLTKVGFSLITDDIPESNPNKNKILKWEHKFWEQNYRNIGFKADIDTTFALYRPVSELDMDVFYSAVRLDRPYSAIHGGWYIDLKNLTDEQKYYMETATSASSWLINSDGKLKRDIYGE